jgi:hypothetical protein
MATVRTVTTKARGSAKRMSLGEVKAFVAEMDEAGAANTTLVTARVGFRGRLMELKATAVRFGDDEAKL